MTPLPRLSDAPPTPIWMVACRGAFATHWSDPDNTYGPFASREEAESFIARVTPHGRIYDGRKEPWR